jgi:hypothetical protein
MKPSSDSASARAQESAEFKAVCRSVVSRDHARGVIVSGILNSISSGLNIKQACRCNGISEDTFRNWRKEDPDLAEQFESARESMRKEMLQVIKDQAPKDWRAAEAHLRLSFAEYRTGNGATVNVGIDNRQVVVNDEERARLIKLREEALADVNTTSTDSSDRSD